MMEKAIKLFLAFVAALVLLECLQDPASTRRHLSGSTVSTSKPVMATFFETVKGGCCGMTQEGHEKLLHAWEDAWQSNGWKTRILTEADAREHPEFETMHEKLLSVGVNDYNQRCFWRWLAMAMESNVDGGGWMSDYDFFPLTLTAQKGIKLAKRPGFKSWATHVPALIHSDKEGWNKLASLMIDSISDDYGLEKITDMFLLKLLHDYLSEEEMGVTLWQNNYAFGFPYVAVENDGSDEESGDADPRIDCGWANSKLGAHLSHYAVEIVAKEKKNYPKIEGMKEGEEVQRRAEAALIMLRDYREICSEKMAD